MKLFSAVVLSLLFCFVKSFKSRAISNRAHLKNVSAHGQAMREPGSDSEEDESLQTRIETLNWDADLLKNQIEEMNAETERQDIMQLSYQLRQSSDEVKDLLRSGIVEDDGPDNMPQSNKKIHEEETQQLNSLLDTIQKLKDEFLEKKQTLNEAAIWKLTPQMEILKAKASDAKKEDDVNEIWDQVEAVREEAQRLTDVVKRMDESEKKKGLTQQVNSFFETREDIKKMFDENRQKQITEELAEIKKEVDTWIPKARQDQKVMDDWNKTTDRLSEMPITERFQTTSQEWESLQEKIWAVRD
eukprot:Platyproteum_vivax@DN7625_c1_g1_i10.p1